MNREEPKAIYLKDYTAPDYRLETVELYFDLYETHTRVMSTLVFSRVSDRIDAPLVLDGQALELKSIALDGMALSSEHYRVDADKLLIRRLPKRFTLRIETEINPQANTSLEGLYMSSGIFCTQCEAEGFRKITYFPDRPDVMAIYTTTIEAERGRYPLLLSNGNPMARGDAASGRHWVRWHDPFKKPSYLFALVAGDLACAEDVFKTCSGREVKLQLYVEHENIDRCDHALASLKKAMRWDEDVFGREYDLDIYMVVAVNDFNMGAMENKGLNVFNSACVLAKPETATDADYLGIQGVIGHEYFHNWSGNRVTCRDWFQLSLKEGLTVFRDQQFTADMYSRAVKRIADVNVLRTRQFGEDAGPMAHAVRPESYIDISNFYTVTVYNKGAEVVRMLYTLLGRERFRRGMDLYFTRHDGQAVTTEDFVRAMEDANAADFLQFRRWYSQAGTPEIRVTRAYDAAAKTYTLTFAQSCPPTPRQSDKEPFHIPVAMGLLGKDGSAMAARFDGETGGTAETRIIELREARQSVRFVDVAAEPVPSLLRGFSAPVKLYVDYSDEELAFLMTHDTDEFNRWEAGQQLAVRVINRLVDDVHHRRPLQLERQFVDAFRAILENEALDKALVAQALTLPNEIYIGELQEVVDPSAIHEARNFVLRQFARELKGVFQHVYHANDGTRAYRFATEDVARRGLKNVCLSYLMNLDDQDVRDLAVLQAERATNMTDALAALNALANADCPERAAALRAFYDKWLDDALVVDKWFALQAGSQLPGTLIEVLELLQHPAFEIKNPNKVRALIGTFCFSNPVRFHEISGAGYALAADQILRLNGINPQMAARMASSLSAWRRYDASRQALMRQQLQRMRAEPDLARDVYEIVAKSLAE